MADSVDYARKHSNIHENVFNLGNSGIEECPLKGRKTKIICTIGPVTKSVETLIELLRAGMNIARLNFSHGSQSYHGETIENIREASMKTKIPCAILLDTKGPEVRTGMLKNGEPVQLVKGQSIKIYCGAPENFLGQANEISVDHVTLSKFLSIGDIIKIDDGLILIKVTKIEEKAIFGELLNSQELGERKGVNLPGIDTGLPALTEKDKSDIRFGVEKKVDIIAPSFINSRADVKKIREVTGDDGKHIKIISKIESVQGLHNFERILDESDGIMVARGDLGVEIPIQKVCMAQKTMITKCNSLGKPIVTATQMLDSMIKNPTPTRAEASDVANAVFDGSDCVMLSGETAKGSYPIEAVKIMASICRRSEMSIDYKFAHQRIKAISKTARGDPRLRTESVTSAAVRIAMELNASLIIALTRTGLTAGLLSKYKPHVPIICVTPDACVARQTLLRKNLWPIFVDGDVDDEQQYEKAMKEALKKGWCKKGDSVVLISGRHNVSESSYQLQVLGVN